MLDALLNLIRDLEDCNMPDRKNTPYDPDFERIALQHDCPVCGALPGASCDPEPDSHQRIAQGVVDVDHTHLARIEGVA